jgi:hypothetical protein
MRALVAIYEKTNSPFDCGRFVEFFMTHPSLVHRVDTIAERVGISQPEVSRFLSQCTEAKHPVAKLSSPQG